ncbi:interleukin-18 receptor 1 [Spea bombifrons]|uniref:interleukin-18 receptor 1 n=1 Tax=Spea bombifrons TaxID=233779 RepID=UPI00234B58A7|nr:interleukin-18 receptor 1 [Spea bombifrons]
MMKLCEGRSGYFILIFLFYLFTGLSSISRCTVEDEYYILKCNWENPQLIKRLLKKNGTYITWYKYTDSNTKVNLSAEVNDRVIANGETLQFWPLHLNDTGMYSCAVENITSRQEKLNVLIKNQDSCYNSSCISHNPSKTGTYANIKIDLYHEYTDGEHSIVWYKDCKWYKEDEKEISFNEVQRSDAADYTYVITRIHKGKSYKCSRKTILTVEDPIEFVKPTISGEKNVTAEIELGQNLSVDCEVFYGYDNKTLTLVYWLYVDKNKIDTNDVYEFVNECDNFSSTTCYTELRSKDNDGKLFARTDLHLINITEEDVMYPYKCQAQNTNGNDEKFVSLKKKEKSPDISHGVFTTSMAVSITCSICIVLIVVLCVVLRIEIVLLYRRLRRIDETIGDGKEYDAYVSYVNHSMNDSEETKSVLNTLPSILENYFGYKLCIFDRDIVPGGAIVDDMDSYLEKCRRLIILLSQNLISDEVLYELESGLHKALVERKIKVILIECTPFSELKAIPESLQLLKASSRVKWEGDKSRPLKSRFWKQIQYLMPAKPIKPRFSFLKAGKSFLPYNVSGEYDILEVLHIIPEVTGRTLYHSSGTADATTNPVNYYWMRGSGPHANLGPWSNCSMCSLVNPALSATPDCTEDLFYNSCEYVNELNIMRTKVYSSWN